MAIECNAKKSTKSNFIKQQAAKDNKPVEQPFARSVALSVRSCVRAQRFAWT